MLKRTACRRKKEDMGGRSSGPSMRVRCYRCRQIGHLSKNCPQGRGAMFSRETESRGRKGEQKVFRQGMIEGKMVKVLLDTGCSRTMVRRNLVPEHKLIGGKGVAIRCAHRDTTFYPLAEIGVEISGRNFKVEAAVADNLPVQLLLGTDVPQLFKLLGREEPELANVDDSLVVTTRAKARQQLEERIQQKEKEIASGAKSHDLELVEVKATVDGTGPRKGAGEPSCGLGLPVSGEELKTLQKQDKTLAEAWRAAEKSPEQNETGYFKEDGVLYRRWVPTGRPEMSIEQLVLPKRCRGTVLEMVHEIPISGHQGKEKTRQRVLRRFFWPSVYKDIEEYCRSCRICQKTTHSFGTRAPLFPLPIISEPFSRMAMDLVGPLPRSRSGNRYVMVMCDYATRYPEAIPLKSIDAEHIAEKMIEVFARVGVPREILTDQGSNFVSQLLAELYRLLQVKPIRTSPYHPQTDGLVERFNKTLKAMLRKTASDDGKDWDRMIPYLLFAYREVPQSSTGFSPFELLHGRDVRGPLDILKETWEADQKSEKSVVSYVMSTQQKLKEMAECVKENMLEKQDKQKQWYDVKARLREFKAGDPVLVLCKYE